MYRDEPKEPAKLVLYLVRRTKIVVSVLTLMPYPKVTPANNGSGGTPLQQLPITPGSVKMLTSDDSDDDEFDPTAAGTTIAAITCPEGGQHDDLADDMLSQNR